MTYEARDEPRDDAPQPEGYEPPLVEDIAAEDDPATTAPGVFKTPIAPGPEGRP